MLKSKTAEGRNNKDSSDAGSVTGLMIIPLPPKKEVARDGQGEEEEGMKVTERDVEVSQSFFHASQVGAKALLSSILLFFAKSNLFYFLA